MIYLLPDRQAAGKDESKAQVCSLGQAGRQ